MLADVLKAQAEIRPANGQRGELKPLVLIIESNADSREMLKTLLEIWGYRTAESENGDESIEAAIRKCPSIILMDISLSKTDGLTTMQRMREIDALRGVPIVFISGRAQPEFRTFALTLVGGDFLVKPVDFNRLEIVLNKFIGKNSVNINSGGITV